MKQLFLDIQQKLRTIPELRYVGEESGQLTTGQSGVEFPCALVGFRDIDFSSTALKSQQAQISVTITLADNPAAPVSGYGLFDLVEKINLLLHAASGERYSSLTRTNLKRADRKDGIREWTLTYRCLYNDSSAAPLYTSATPIPRFTPVG